MTLRVGENNFIFDDSYTPPRIVGLKQADGRETFFGFGYSQPTANFDYGPAPVHGTWTPSFTFATPGDLSVTYSSRAGYYTRHGDMVDLYFRMIMTPFTFTTASGAATINGLPFPVANLVSYTPEGYMQWAGITKANYTHFYPYGVLNTSALGILGSGSGQVSAVINAADIPSGGTPVLIGNLRYRAVPA